MFQPIFTRIQTEDLGQTPPKAITPIVYQLNLVIDYLKTAFTKNITLQDNLINPFKQIQLISTGVPSTDTTAFSVALPSGYQPKGVQIINCTDASGSIVGNAVWAEMMPGLQNNNVVVRAIYGLTVGHTYNFTFMVY